MHRQGSFPAGGSEEGEQQGRKGSLHVGVVGVGRMGVFHARELARSPQVEAVTVTDSDLERAGRVADELGAGCAPTLDALLSEGVEALVIASPTPTHGPLILRAVGAGVPVYCEKPVALDLATVDAVIDAVAGTGIMVQVGFQRRFDAGYRAAREAVSSGAIGDVHLVRLATHDPAPPPEAYVASSGGIWLDLAIHDFDVASWVVGRRVVEVYAEGQAHSEVFVRHGDVDAGCAILRFEGGALGVVTSARNDPRGYDVRMEVFGMRDSVTVGWDGRIPLRSLEPGADEPSQPGYTDFMERFAPAYREALRHFMEAARTRGPSPCTVEEARASLAVGLAVQRSCREHRPVRVAEIG